MSEIIKSPSIIKGLSPAEEAAQVNIRLKKAREKKEKKLKQRYKNIQKQFSEWLADESYFDDYKMFDLRSKDILVRVFQYREEAPKEKVVSNLYTDMDTDKTLGTYTQNFPYAKVIDVGPLVKDLEPGDVITIADSLGGHSINPEYTEWLEANEEAMNSRPQGKVKGEMPPMHVDNLISWSKYTFVANKLAPRTPDDYLTFLVPDNFAITKIKSDNEIS